MGRFAHATLFIDQHGDLAPPEEDIVRFIINLTANE